MTDSSWVEYAPLTNEDAGIQTACDRCTQGVMDQDNPHLHGRCSCQCHARPTDDC